MENSMAENSRADRRTWETSADVCALCDEERHLGHVVKIANRWAAYDTTKLNLSCTGFLCLGTFASQAAARHAVEQSANALGQYDLADLRSMVVAAAVI